MANIANKSGASCLPQAPLPAYKPISPMSRNDETNDSWQAAHDGWEEIAITETLSRRARNNLPRKRFCRICHQTEEKTKESGDDREKRHTTDLEAAPIHKAKGPRTKSLNFKENPLIHPCMCVGSLAYIHVDCLNKWRTDSLHHNTYYHCGNCKYKYNLSRPRWAAIVGNVVFLKMIAVFLFLLLLVGVSYLAKVVDVYGLHHTPDPDIQNWYYFHGETVLWLDRFYLLMGLIIILVLGLVYLLVICVIEGPRGIDNMVCCGNSGSGITNAGVDGDAGIIVLACVLVFCWLMILVIIYMAIEKAMGKMLSNVKERILEVPCK
ncbi:hypothetical protein BC937DRAFT_87060 [Endogone sp. FLAS-F59071]|nr:hypothetical protein BC937DRAFT_87060 [Endogone sp. FLAS-F59071]|eukprot:RUS19710.1 hypothetical protein BC937DRAFT_87060 [Endogone sp. FLAS-F59071]